MAKLYLTYHEYSSGGESLSEDEWPEYSDTNIEWNLEKCFNNRSKKKTDWLCESFEVDFTPQLNDDIYVVYVRYRTGDTFSYINGVWKIIGVYNNKEDAKKIQESIKNNTYDGYKPWEGFFEILESCEIEEMVVE